MRRRRGRDIDGILLLDKPTGISSNQALQRARRLFDARKAGHTGNLDVLASGLLPLCLGEASKFSSFLLDADKRYLAECRLGVTTSTGDAEGEILRQVDATDITRADLERVLPAFRGEIEQVPPMYSALKHQGQPLYKLARQGRTVERKPRRVRIDGIEITAFSGPDFSMDVRCSKGTYIRTLAGDIGEALGCGASLVGLRRLASGPFRLADALDFDRLEGLAGHGMTVLDAVLLPIDAALGELPRVGLGEDGAYYLCQGQAVRVNDSTHTGLVRVYTRAGRFLGLGTLDGGGGLAPKRLIRQQVDAGP